MMLNHACVAVHSTDAAREVFEHLFGFHPVYSFHIESKTIEMLFGIRNSADAIVYDANNTRIEVFIVDDMSRSENPFNHLCFSFQRMNLKIGGHKL